MEGNNELDDASGLAEEDELVLAFLLDEAECSEDDEEEDEEVFRFELRSDIVAVVVFSRSVVEDFDVRASRVFSVDRIL